MAKHPDLAEEKVKIMEERKKLKEDLSTSFSKRDSDQLLKLEARLGNILEQIRRKETHLLKKPPSLGQLLQKQQSMKQSIERESMSSLLTKRAWRMSLRQLLQLH